MLTKTPQQIADDCRRHGCVEAADCILILQRRLAKALTKNIKLSEKQLKSDPDFLNLSTKS